MTPLADAVARTHRSGERTLARQIALAHVPAPTGQEAARRGALQEMLQHDGFMSASGAHVAQDGAGNLIARLEPADTFMAAGGDVHAAPVVCMAHLDTVFPAGTALHPTRDGPLVSCPGIGDNGRGLAAMLLLAEQFAHPDVRRHMRRPIEFVATVGEEGEGNLRGARHYFDGRTAHDVSAVLVLDGPGDTTIVHHAIASARLRIAYSGPGGHAWIDRALPNPIHALGSAIVATGRLAATLPRDASAVVTRTGGGETITSIAERAWYDVDLRARDELVLTRLIDSVRRIARANAASCTCDITVLGERPGGSLEATHPLVSLAGDVTRWCGLEPVSAMASTDANIPLSRGIPAITIGAGGSGGGAHTANEWFDNREGTRGIVRALGIVAALSMN